MIFEINYHPVSLYISKKSACLEAFLAAELRVIGYVLRFLTNTISKASGNNLIGEFLLLESSVLNYDESLPMSGTCVQSVKTLAERVYILMGVQLSHCRTSLRQGPQTMRQAKSTVLPGNWSQNMTNRAYYIFHMNCF